MKLTRSERKQERAMSKHAGGPHGRDTVLAVAEPREQVPVVVDAGPEAARTGAVLEAARNADRTWRKGRSAALQARIDKTVHLEKLGHRLRAWSWPCMLGGAGLGGVAMIVMILLVGSRNEGRLPPLQVLMTYALPAFGLALLPASKLLRIVACVWRKVLLWQAARDHLEVSEPARIATPARPKIGIRSGTMSHLPWEMP